jgi:Cation/multidrug efflux pump
MMTNLAAVLGILPIAIGVGAGAESRVPLGVAVAGGIIVSQFLTLYVTPAFYVLFEGWKERWRGVRCLLQRLHLTERFKRR